jgi:hypothetical protein
MTTPLARALVRWQSRLARLSIVAAVAGAALLGAAPARAVDAIKIYILIDMAPGVDVLVLDRWYLTFHAPERRDLVRAWQRHYVSYRTYAVPEEVDRFNVWRGRMTEIHFDSLEDFAESRKNSSVTLQSHTAPPGGWGKAYRSEAITLPAAPTEDFLGQHPAPKETPYYRWIVALRYPEGVTEEDGERWFLETHAEETAKLPGLRRYIGYRAVGRDRDPTVGRDRPVARERGYQRVVELWFDSYQDWRKAILESPPAFTAPPWGGEYPFVEMISTFIGERPDVDFINDRRVIP